MRSLRVARKSDGEHLATVARSFGPDAAAQDLHQVLGNCKPQAESPGFSRAGSVDLVEPLEHPAPVFRGDAWTVVPDADQNLFADDLGVDVDRGAWGRELGGVVV